MHTRSTTNSRARAKPDEAGRVRPAADGDHSGRARGSTWHIQYGLLRRPTRQGCGVKSHGIINKTCKTSNARSALTQKKEVSDSPIQPRRNSITTPNRQFSSLQIIAPLFLHFQNLPLRPCLLLFFSLLPPHVLPPLPFSSLPSLILSSPLLFFHSYLFPLPSAFYLACAAFDGRLAGQPALAPNIPTVIPLRPGPTRNEANPRFDLTQHRGAATATTSRVEPDGPPAYRIHVKPSPWVRRSRTADKRARGFWGSGGVHGSSNNELKLDSGRSTLPALIELPHQSVGWGPCWAGQDGTS